MTISLATLRNALIAIAILSISGCGALGNVSEAAAPAAAFTLSPVSADQVASGSRHLVVREAVAAGALMTDRMLIKPNRLQAEYLPDGRWSDPAPLLVQTLMVQSLQNAGGFSLVGRNDDGLLPDYSLLIDLRDFQAEVAADGAVQVRVGMILTMVWEMDRRIAGTRRFESVVAAQSDGTADIVAAFDAALTRTLAEGVAWTLAQGR